MKKLIAIGLVVCILLTVLVSGASAAPPKQISRGTITISNDVSAIVTSSPGTSSSANLLAYTGVSTNNRGITATGVTQASLSGTGYLTSSQSLSGCIYFSDGS